MVDGGSLSRYLIKKLDGEGDGVENAQDTLDLQSLDFLH